MQLQRPFTGGGLMGLGAKDPSYDVCRHELFKTTKRFDGPHHREQHGFSLTG